MAPTQEQGGNSNEPEILFPNAGSPLVSPDRPLAGNVVIATGDAHGSPDKRSLLSIAFLGLCGLANVPRLFVSR
jgi:hypothetical protein